jgi:hypothetical protein
MDRLGYVGGGPGYPLLEAHRHHCRRKFRRFGSGLQCGCDHMLLHPLWLRLLEVVRISLELVRISLEVVRMSHKFTRGCWIRTRKEKLAE